MKLTDLQEITRVNGQILDTKHNTLQSWAAELMYDKNWTNAWDTPGWPSIVTWGKNIPDPYPASLFLQETHMADFVGCPTTFLKNLGLHSRGFKTYHNIHKHIHSVGANLVLNHVPNLLGAYLIECEQYNILKPGGTSHVPLTKLFNDSKEAGIDVHEFQERLIAAGFKKEAQL